LKHCDSISDLIQETHDLIHIPITLKTLHNKTDIIKVKVKHSTCCLKKRLVIRSPYAISGGSWLALALQCIIGGTSEYGLTSRPTQY